MQHFVFDYFIFAIGSIRVMHICENTFQPILKFCLESKPFRASKKLDQNSIFTLFFLLIPQCFQIISRAGAQNVDMLSSGFSHWISNLSRNLMKKLLLPYLKSTESLTRIPKFELLFKTILKSTQVISISPALITNRKHFSSSGMNILTYNPADLGNWSRLAPMSSGLGGWITGCPLWPWSCVFVVWHPFKKMKQNISLYS